MTTSEVNYLNIGLMLLSATVALFLPFEMFVFSYAILGPLHYVTEISWLHKRQYFCPGKRDYMLLVLLTFLIVFPFLFASIYNYADTGDIVHRGHYHRYTILFYSHMKTIGRMMVFVAFAGAITLILTKNTTKRVIAFALITALAYIIHKGDFINVLFVIFVPTLVHVFIFTGAFILTGTLKSRSFSGMLSLVVFLSCGIALFLFNPGFTNHPGSYIQSRYVFNFLNLNRHIFAVFLHQNASEHDIYYSGAGILITRFIAYAYTYHYLNWFSKTTVIKWNDVSRRAMFMILAIWLLSVALYFTNYKMGLEVLYFMSMLHVVLEFPLNFQSFRDIGKQITGRKLQPGSS